MALQIIVCVKSVVVKPPKRNKVDRSAGSIDLNPFDKPAIELAVRLKAQFGGSITALTMGPKSAETALYDAMSMGADRGILLCDPALAGSDTLATSLALSAALKKINDFDLLLFGVRTSDSDTGQVGPQVAELMQLPFVSGLESIEPDGQGFKLIRLIDGFVEEFKAMLPVAMSVHPSAVVPRDSSLSGIEESFEVKPIELIKADELGLDPGVLGEAGSPTRVAGMKKIPKEKKCEFIDGSDTDIAAKLLKVITETGVIS